jgi:membrane glycosyltransferase
VQAFPRSIKREILTPTLTQSVFELRWRRRFVGVINVLTYLLIVYAFSKLAMKGGWTIVDVLMMLCVVVATPWTVLGFWNSLIGLWLLHSGSDARSSVVPLANAGDGPDPITIRVAVLMTLRNEDPHRAFERLRAVKASVDATPYGGQFGYFLLSDSDNIEVAAEELRLYNNWRDREPGTVTLVYRRRHKNTGYKAGNLRDFCETWGDDFEVMLPLDADSLMDGETIVRMARIMQFHPRLGILQSLVVGMPSKARLRASSSLACATACAPTPWAPRGGRGMRPLLGAQCVCAHQAVPSNTASFPSCRAHRRWAAICSVMIRSRRR